MTDVSHDRSALFLSPYPSSAPSHRVRIEQYLPFLRAANVHARVSSLLDDTAYRDRGVRRSVRALTGTAARLRDLIRSVSSDVVVVHREAVPWPTSIVERIIGRISHRLVFDFDDAIYLPQPFTSAPLARWLRSPAKFAAIVAAADLTIAGNDHLAARARRYSDRVTVIPTTVDTDRINPRGDEREKDIVRIGWIGSPSTAHYLSSIGPVLRDVLSAHANARFAVVGGHAPPEVAATTEVRSWTLDGEAADLGSFDIGIMPLPDDEWARGKCGYKALQYMAAGIPTISSPVGVATEMIEHGRTGLLVDAPAEWAAALSRMIDDRGMRRRIGLAGRADVERRYSVKVWAPRLYEVLFG